MKNNLKKRIVMIAAILGLAVVGISGGTMAYFTATETKTNVFTNGDLEIGIKEPEWNPDEDGDGQNMYPGYTVYKNPTVKNVTDDKNGEEPGYVRMSIEILDENAEAITDQEALDLIYQAIRYDPSFTGKYDSAGGQGSKLTEGRIPGYSLKDLESIPMVNPDWLKDEERSTPSKLVFNYAGKEGDGILDIGEESTLFTDIVIPTDWNQTQIKKIGDFKLKITQEGIQVKGFATQSDAYKALDKEISDGTIQPGKADNSK